MIGCLKALFTPEMPSPSIDIEEVQRAFSILVNIPKVKEEIPLPVSFYFYIWIHFIITYFYAWMHARMLHLYLIYINYNTAWDTRARNQVHKYGWIWGQGTPVVCKNENTSPTLYHFHWWRTLRTRSSWPETCPRGSRPWRMSKNVCQLSSPNCLLQLSENTTYPGTGSRHPHSQEGGGSLNVSWFYKIQQSSAGILITSPQIIILLIRLKAWNYNYNYDILIGPLYTSEFMAVNLWGQDGLR